MRFRILAAASLVALGLGTTVASADGVVNVYNARHYGTDKMLWDGFTKQTGITVNVIDGNHDELIQRLIAEGANSPGDLFITVDAGRLAFAAGKDLLQPVRSETLEAEIPVHLREPNGLWYGLAVRARVIMYAKGKIDPAIVQTYESLAEPALKDKLLIRSSTNVYNLSLVGSLIAADGAATTETWAKGVVANMARPPEGGDTDQIKAVAAGIGAVAVSNTYYLGRLANSDKPEEKAVAEQIGVVFPNQDNRGTHVNISGAGVLKNAPNRENATKLLEYLLSPEAQEYFANVNLEYPVNKAVKPNPFLVSLGEFKHDTLNAATFAANSVEAAEIMDRAGWK